MTALYNFRITSQFVNLFPVNYGYALPYNVNDDELFNNKHTCIILIIAII